MMSSGDGSEDEEDQGGVHPAMKAAVFACMAGAMILRWRIHTAEELPNVDVPSGIALLLHMLVCVTFLLAMVFVNFIFAALHDQSINTLSSVEKL
nr:hypothetical protein DM860_009168 [Ipomoea trifida]